MFTRRTGKQYLPDEWSLGPLTLHYGGDFSLGPLRFDQACTIEDSSFGDALVNKARGIGQELRIDIDGGHHLRFAFDGSSWFRLV